MTKRRPPRAPTTARRPPRRAPDAGTPRPGQAGGPSDPAGNTPFPIVGIGASAGGLEAVSRLLRELPVGTGMGFVLVQHLDPSHESRLPEILSKTTAMPVITVSDRLRPEPNHVYVIPPNVEMTIAGGLFALSPRAAADRHMPIDHFFRSLAEEQEARAVGVVLSGTGSDGTLGLRAIKAAGGIGFTQDAQSATHPGMPQSASAVADAVLPPAEIARELARIGHHPYVNDVLSVNDVAPSGVAPGQPEGEGDVGAVLRALRTATGVDFTQYKPAGVRRRIARRMLLQKIDDLGSYVRHLRQTPHEAQALHDDILIQVTGFFRNPEGFEALRRTVFPSLVKERPADEPIRIWVPGCASGEEAYSLAICLLEFLGEADTNLPIQMFATDLGAAAVTRARSGTFPASIESEVSPQRLQRFFATTDGRYQIRKAIRDACVFAQHDLTRDPPFSKLDLISCCNVLIYLGAALQDRVLPSFHYALKPTGFLRVGPSESVGRFTNLFSVIDKTHRIYARNPGPAAHLSFGLTTNDRTAAPVRGGTPAPREPAGGRGVAIEKEADRLILGRYAPAGVVVNADMEIVQFRGKTGAYFEATSGAASFNVFRMAREGLPAALRRAVQQAARRGDPVRAEGLRIRTNGGIREVSLEVIPIRPTGATDRHYLILFFEARARSAPPARERDPRPKTTGERRLAQLTRELADSHRNLHAITEEQEAAARELRAATEEAQSSNEELQSANEELQSTNEELETAREELQATNEELTTVNDELNSRNLELGQLTNDLGNVLASVQVPIILVGGDLRIRRMTPVTERVLGVAPSDVGRAIGDLRLRVEIPDLEARLRDVIETLTVLEREVQGRDGLWYSVRVRPYRTTENRIDGAVLSFVDVDALKRAGEQAQEAHDRVRAIVETVREPLVILDAGFRVVTANASFYETFQVEPPETEGREVFGLGNRQWDLPRLRTLLEEVLPRDSVMEDFEVEGDFQAIGRRTMLLNARRVLSATGEPALILLAIEDVTERRRGEKAIRELGAIVEGSEDAIFSRTVDGLITSWNRGAERLFGYPADEVIGRPITVIIPPERHDEEIELLARLRRGEGARYETVRVRRDGVRLDISLTVSPVCDAAGQIVGASKIAQDITERKRTERERAELLAREQAVRAEAVAANTAKDRFLAILSHELRNPLNAMLGWTRILRTQTLDPAATARALEVIERNTVLQVRLIEDLLDMSRIVADTLRLEARPVMPGPVIEAAIAAMGPAADAKGVRLEGRLDGAAGPIQGDPARLQQIVSNLVANAIKFTPSGGRVDVVLARRESAVEISVRDTGQGISAEQIPELFTRFGGAHTSTQSQGGMGLGLAIVRRLVELHNGDVRAESAGPGHGATFTVTLPLADEGPAEAEAIGIAARAGASGPPPTLHGVRVLVVDDEADARELMGAILDQYGAEVTLAATARGALETLDRASFDVLVSDIAMPQEDGYDLIRQVRALDAERHGRIPALALTAYARIDDRAAAIAAGYQQHMAKPIEPAALAAAVATLVGRAQGKRGG